MSQACPSCGGEIGTDCFNPGECADITVQMRQQEESPGRTVTLSHEHILGGVRFDPGRYRITRIDHEPEDDFPF